MFSRCVTSNCIFYTFLSSVVIPFRLELNFNKRRKRLHHHTQYKWTKLTKKLEEHSRTKIRLNPDRECNDFPRSRLGFENAKL